MKKGREERVKVTEMLTRGIPGTETHEEMLIPFNFKTNKDLYKSTFDTYNHSNKGSKICNYESSSKDGNKK